MSSKSDDFGRYLKSKSKLKTKIMVFGEAKFSRVLPFLISQKIMDALELDSNYVTQAHALKTEKIQSEIEFATDMGITKESFENAYYEYLKSFLR